MSNFMSKEMETEKQAQDLHKPQGLFDPAAVFKNEQGQFVMMRLRNVRDCPPHSDIAHVEDLVKMTCVSVCSPMLMVWKAYKIDERPITAEWLESLGYKKEKKYSWAEYRLPVQDGFFELVASFFDGSQNVKLMHYERGNILPHIKTRHDFSELYRLLAGMELGE